MERDSFLAEQWKEIAGYPDYEVSTHGRVRRITEGHLIAAGGLVTCSFNKEGRRKVCLGSNNYFLISHLVTSTFLGPKPVGYEIHHKDKDLSNDLLYNLEYISVLEHKNKHVKISDEDIDRMLTYSRAGYSSRKIAEIFGVSAGHVRGILTGSHRKGHIWKS